MRRPRLTDSFAIRAPSTVISAPAGSGKTTLALQWLGAQNARTAWLSLDMDDNDPMRFIRGFVAALQVTGKAEAARGRRPSEAQDDHGPDQPAGRDRPHRICADDYHLIADESIREALAYFWTIFPTPSSLCSLQRRAASASGASERVDSCMK